MKKVALAFVILALTSSVAMAGVVKYRGSHHEPERVSEHKTEKSHDCEYRQHNDGKWNTECED